MNEIPNDFHIGRLFLLDIHVCKKNIDLKKSRGKASLVDWSRRAKLSLKFPA